LQKRLVRKLDLERLLSQVKPHPTPSPDLEQYTIPSDVAAMMLYVAAYTYGDIVGKSVLDLGCGTGRLALGAAFLGAKQVVGVDLDKAAVRVAVGNSIRTGLRGKVQWVAADIDVVCGQFDTVLQNPPYGVQVRRADRKFLEKAMATSNVAYSLHKSTCDGKIVRGKSGASVSGIVSAAPSPFIEKFVEEHGGSVRAVYAMIMTIPHMFSFHTKMKHEFIVDLYVIDTNRSKASET
jgi:putative methylase